jgi:hypothetical protein
MFSLGVSGLTTDFAVFMMTSADSESSLFYDYRLSERRGPYLKGDWRI